MVTFFPLTEQSAVPGGLGRWLLSCDGCCAQARVKAASAKVVSTIPIARFLRIMMYVLSERAPLSPSEAAVCQNRNHAREGLSSDFPKTGIVGELLQPRIEHK